MTASALSHVPPAATGRHRSTFAWSVNDVVVLTRRSLARIAREPESLMDVTVMPVIFVLLFSYVFGSAIHLPGGGNYHEYLIGGMFGMGMAGTAPGTAVGMSNDMSTGLIDRFKSLPMSRAAVLAGRTLADLLTQVIGLVVVVAMGLVIGWRVHTGPGDVALALALSLLLAYAFTWVGACLGMAMRNAEAAQATGFILFMPLTFVSSAFVATQGMTSWLQTVANWNPLSVLADACRHLFGNPNPAAAVHTWPLQHPELAVVLWSAGLIAVFAPLSVRMYRRRAQ